MNTTLTRFRTSLIVLLVTGVAAWRCADLDKDKEPGVDVVMPDDGMPDTGMPDTGMPDTGMPDTGMPGTISIPPGPALFGISTDGDDAGMFVLAHPGLPDASVVGLPFSQFRQPDMAGVGVDQGIPQSVSVDRKRQFVSLSVQWTARVIVWNAVQQVTTGLVASGDSFDKTSRGTLSVDGRFLYVANPTSNRVVKVEVATPKVVQAIDAGVSAPDLKGPSSVTLLPSGRLVVGSSSRHQDRLLVFDDSDGAFLLNSSLSATLLDGAFAGGGPGPCVAIPGEAYLYCASATYAPADAGTSSDAGVQGYLWKWTPGQAPKAVATTRKPATALAIAPLGHVLYAATGNRLEAYWIGSSASNAPPLLDAIPSGSTAPYYDVVASPDGKLVYASIPQANKLLVIRAEDFTVLSERLDLARPGPLFFSAPQ